MSTFEDFLTANRSRSLEMGDDAVPVFNVLGPVSEDLLLAAEAHLGSQLPRGYKQFVLACGSGEWCGDLVAAPSAVYAFDEDCGGMEGFLTLVHNVRGVGDFVAMNPNEQTGPEEWALYYCSHDPFGFAKVADTFEEWAREALVAMETGSDPYDKLYAAVDETWKAYRKDSKRWWQFWR